MLLSDGIPPMEQVMSTSGAYIPHESQHASCEQEVVGGFKLQSVSLEVKNSSCTMWRQALHYASEADVVFFVRTYLLDVAYAMNIPLEMASNFGIKHMATNIFALSLRGRLVGVIVIKKPQKNALEMPTVLGELFDQMILVEGFYMSGPVIGILTTLEDWLFCWFPANTAHFISEFEDYAATPHKASSTVGDSRNPLRDNPSIKNKWLHGVEPPEDDREDPGEFELTEETIARALCTSPVINAHTQYDILLQYLCSSFTRMSQGTLSHREGVPRSLFKLRKGVDVDARPKISYHPVKSIPLSVENIQSNSFPRAHTTMLLALEDLGRGSTGRAWLCCTLSSSPALCVLKFSNSRDCYSLLRLEDEKKMWDAVYPQFRCMTKLEVWGGSEALVMPHMCAIPKEDREEFRSSIHELLLNTYHGRGYRHLDVEWRNIGCYVREDNVKLPILFDLERVSTVVESDVWVTDALRRLYEPESRN